MNLPLFPTFRHIGLEDKEWFEEFFAQLDPYADLSFGNLMIWMDQEDDCELSKIGDNLVLRFSDVFSGEPETPQIYTLLGTKDLRSSVHEIFAYQQQQGLQARLEMLPRNVADAIADDEDIRVEVDRDHSEYILDAAAIANLSGSKFRSLREDCNSFKRRYGADVTIKKLDITDQNNVQQLQKCIETWERGYANGDGLTAHEVEAIDRLFRFAKILDHQSLCIYIKGKLEGFVLYRYFPQKEWVMPNIIKLNYDYQDIFDFAVFAFANEVVDHGVKYINFEQDLGLPGLRQYKSSLKPIDFLNKYSAALN